MLLSILITVYNEENRLSEFIEHHSFCEHFYIAVKKSEDKTREKALNYGNVTVIDLPFSQASQENKHFKSLILPKIKSKWVLAITVSDRVSQSLYEQIIISIQQEDCDMLSLPFQNYIFNINSPTSPFPGLCYKSLACKTNVADFSAQIHNEIQHTSKKEKRIPYAYGSVKHYSQTNTDEKFVNKTFWYARTEVDHYEVIGLHKHPYVKHPIISLLKIFFNGFFRRKTILDRKNGAFLGFAYLLNHIMIMFILFYELHRLNKEE